MEFDTIRPSDEVTTTIIGPEDHRLYQATTTDIHTVEEAIRLALANAALVVKPESCVFVVTNNTTDVSHEYRLNAHGNLTLIV